MKTKVITDLSALEFLKKNLPDTSIIGDKFTIIKYGLTFHRRSKNLYENIRVVCIFTYDGKDFQLPFYWNSGVTDDEDRISMAKKICQKYNAPRAPFWKDISEKEFYKIASEIGLKGLNHENVKSSINFGIKNGHFE